MHEGFSQTIKALLTHQLNLKALLTIDAPTKPHTHTDILCSVYMYVYTHTHILCSVYLYKQTHTHTYYYETETLHT